MRPPRNRRMVEPLAVKAVVRHPLTMATDPRRVAKRWADALTDHDLEAAVYCFAPSYRDTAPARRGEALEGRDQVRANFAALFENITELRADLLATVADGETVWMEWRMSGTRADGTTMEFVGVNIFDVQDDHFTRGCIYTEVRDAGGIDSQMEEMTHRRDGV